MSRRQLLIPVLLLAAFTLLVYARILHFQFLDWDDWQLLAQNPDFLPVAWGKIAGYWTHSEFGLYTPLSYTAWAAIASMEQAFTHRIPLSPGGFHLANLLLHLATVEMVFLLLCRLIQQPLAAFVGAMVFALHPLQIEPVAWIASFNTLSCSFFAVTALWAYVHYAQSAETESREPQTFESKKRSALPPPLVLRPVVSAVEPGRAGAGVNLPKIAECPHPNPPRFDCAHHRPEYQGRGLSAGFAHVSVLWFAASCAALLAALFSKPTALAAPLIALLIDLMILRRSWRRSWGPILIWTILVVPFAIAGRLSQSAYQATQIALPYRPLVVADSFAFYLAKLFWPMHQTIDYQRSPIRLLHSGQIYFTWIITVAAFLLAWFFSRRRNNPPWLLAGLAIMFAATLPTSGIAGFSFQRYSTVADRYIYLGMVGVAIAIAGSVMAWRRYQTVIALIVIGTIFMVRDAVRLTDWSDTLALTARAQDAGDRSALEHRIRGFALSKLGYPDEAIAQYQMAISFDAVDADTYYDFANLLCRHGQVTNSLPMYEKAITLQPRRAEFHHNYAVALMAAGDSRRAGNEFRAATELDPASQQIQSDYAKWLRMQK